MFFLSNSEAAFPVAGVSTITNLDGEFGAVNPITFTGEEKINGNMFLRKLSLVISNLSKNSSINVRINDLRGRLFIRKSYNSVSSGYQQIQLLGNTSKISDGIYIVSVKIDRAVYTFRSLVQNNSFSGTALGMVSYATLTSYTSAELGAITTAILYL